MRLRTYLSVRIYRSVHASIFETCGGDDVVEDGAMSRMDSSRGRKREKMRLAVARFVRYVRSFLLFAAKAASGAAGWIFAEWCSLLLLLRAAGMESGTTYALLYHHDCCASVDSASNTGEERFDSFNFMDG